MAIPHMNIFHKPYQIIQHNNPIYNIPLNEVSTNILCFQIYKFHISNIQVSHLYMYEQFHKSKGFSRFMIQHQSK